MIEYLGPARWCAATLRSVGALDMTPRSWNVSSKIKEFEIANAGVQVYRE